MLWTGFSLSRTGSRSDGKSLSLKNRARSLEIWHHSARFRASLSPLLPSNNRQAVNERVPKLCQFQLHVYLEIVGVKYELLDTNYILRIPLGFLRSSRSSHRRKSPNPCEYSGLPETVGGDLLRRDPLRSKPTFGSVAFVKRNEQYRRALHIRQRQVSMSVVITRSIQTLLMNAATQS